MKKKYYIHSRNTKNELCNKIEYLAGHYELERVYDVEEADVMISVGGDGTFLEAARLGDKPIIGVNNGTLGYLTEVEEHHLTDILYKYSKNDYNVQERMMLYCCASIDETYIDTPISNALNDIVISKKDSSVIGFKLVVDGICLNSYIADGIIIATPTGSTGYSLSCGGPIVAPDSESIIITLISPHTMINRSIVVSSQSKIRIIVVRAREDMCCKLSIDGNSIVVPVNTDICVKKSKKKTKIVTFTENNFLERIRQKMG